MSHWRPILQPIISLKALGDFLSVGGHLTWHIALKNEDPLLSLTWPKSCPFKNTHPCCPLKTIVLPSLHEPIKQDTSALDENNKFFQVGSILPAEQAAALCHFSAINLLSHEERKPNFKTAYCVLPASVAVRHWEEKTQLFQASVHKQERQTRDWKRLDNTPTAPIESAHIAARTKVVFFVQSQVSQWTSCAEDLTSCNERNWENEDLREPFGYGVGHGGRRCVLPREINYKRWNHCWYGCDRLPTMDQSIRAGVQ